MAKFRAPFFALVLILPLLLAAPANAYGHRSACNHRHTTDVSRTTWLHGFFAGHDVEVEMHACLRWDHMRAGKARHFVYHSRPRVDLPSSGPQGALETLKVTHRPYLYSVSRSGFGNVVQRLEYRWSIKQCSIKAGPIEILCNSFRFRQVSTTIGTHTCVHLSRGWRCGRAHVWG